MSFVRLLTINIHHFPIYRLGFINDMKCDQYKLKTQFVYTVIMRFVIAVVFFEITNVVCVCVYSSNTIIFIGII